MTSSVHLLSHGKAFVTFHNTFGTLEMLWFVQLYLFMEVGSRLVIDHLLWCTKLKVNGVKLHELWLDNHICILMTCGMYDHDWFLGLIIPYKYNRPWISYSKPTHFFENPWAMAILFQVSPWGVSQSINIWSIPKQMQSLFVEFPVLWYAQRGRNQSMAECRNLNGIFQRSKGK